MIVKAQLTTSTTMISSNSECSILCIAKRRVYLAQWQWLAASSGSFCYSPWEADKTSCRFSKHRYSFATEAYMKLQKKKKGFFVSSQVTLVHHCSCHKSLNRIDTG